MNILKEKNFDLVCQFYKKTTYYQHEGVEAVIASKLIAVREEIEVMKEWEVTDLFTKKLAQIEEEEKKR